MSGDSVDLIFDPTVDYGSPETYSSHTDLNEIPVFTDEFQAAVAKIRQDEEQEMNYLKTMYFTGNMETVNTDDALLEQLFTSTTTEVLKNERINDSEEQQLPWLLVIGSLFVFFLLLLFYSIDRNRKMESRMKKIEESEAWNE